MTPVEHLPHAHDNRQNLGLSCRWLYGAVRQQCAGHLPFERRETANGGFSILPTGSIDPLLSLAELIVRRRVSESNCHSPPLTSSSGMPSAALRMQAQNLFRGR